MFTMVDAWVFDSAGSEGDMRVVAYACLGDVGGCVRMDVKT